MKSYVNYSYQYIRLSYKWVNGKNRVMQIPRAGNNMVSIIYVKFDHVDAGNSLVNSLLRNELKECVSITAITKTFLYSHKNETVTVQ